MKKLFTYLLLMVTVLCNAQENPQKPIIRKDKSGMVSYVKFTELVNSKDIPSTPDDFFNIYIGISVSDQFKQVSFPSNDKESLHMRFEQYYNDIKVDGAGYVLHSKNGKIYLAQGHYVKIEYLNTLPSINQEQAKDAFAKFKQIPIVEISDFKAPLIIKEVRNIEGKDTTLINKLVYSVYLQADNENNNETGFVDAQTGKVLFTIPNVFKYSATGYFNSTRYNGPRYATTHFYSGNFHLVDSTRGAVIHTWNLNGNTNYASKVELSDANNEWTTAEYNSNEIDMALDIHWGLQNIYDYILNNHGIDSYDGSGSIINACIDYGSSQYDRDDAAWNNSDKYMWFGDGAYKYKPVASIDAVSHEYGHALSSSYVGWQADPYNPTPQAFAEGLSDIWAAILEYRINNLNYVWKIGEQIVNPELATSARNLQNPSDSYAYFQMADTYGSSIYNNGGPYERSGVFSHWFYHLVNGGGGVTGINIDIAEDIVAAAEFNGYLQFTYEYSDIRQAMLDAAEEILDYSYCSNVYKQIQNAWYAVGVGNAAPSYTAYISGDYTLQLGTEGHWTVQGSGGCIGNYTYDWYFNDQSIPFETGTNLAVTFEDEYYEPQQIYFHVKVYDGECYANSDNYYVQLTAHDLLSASISGDEFVCLDGTGFWSADVTGGEGEYTYEWHLNDSNLDDGPSYAHDFPSGTWNPSYNHLDLRVYDEETYVDADPFYFDLDWCLQMKGDSVQLSPNPANDFIDISITDYPNLELDKSLAKGNSKKLVFKSGASEDYIYCIVDNAGKPLYQKKTTEKYLRINTSAFIPGIYHLKVFSSKGMTNKRIIIIH